MKTWNHMELSDSKGFGWDGRYMLYELTIDGWNDQDLYSDMERLVTIRMNMDPNTGEREFHIHFHHENSETNIHLMQIVEIGVDALLTDSRIDLDENVRENFSPYSELDFDDEE